MFQRLDLVPPDPEPEGERTTADSPGPPFDPALKPDPKSVQVVQNMAKDLAAAQKPEWLYLCNIVGTGLLTFHASAKDKPVVLLFTTPLAALDYIGVTKITAQVNQVQFEAVPEMAGKWLAAGAGSLALNRCPRCPVILSVPLGVIADKERFAMVWAVRRATQLYFGQRAVRQFMTTKDNAARKSALELIRDHVDCSVPYAYEFLAFFAHCERDGVAKNAALDRLKQFGPYFANWESKWEISSTETWTRAMAEAMTGLCLSFGMQVNPSSQVT